MEALKKNHNIMIHFHLKKHHRGFLYHTERHQINFVGGSITLTKRIVLLRHHYRHQITSYQCKCQTLLQLCLFSLNVRSEILHSGVELLSWMEMVATVLTFNKIKGILVLNNQIMTDNKRVVLKQGGIICLLFIIYHFQTV